MTEADGSRCKLAYLTNIPSPYRRDMIVAWAAADRAMELSVFYTDADDQGRGWSVDGIQGVPETRLPILFATKKYGKLNRGLRRLVAANDVIMIGGFEQASYLVAALWAKLLGKRVLLLFDGFSPARFNNEPWYVLALKRMTARLADGFFANGAVSARYLRERIGVPPSRPLRNQFLSHSQSALTMIDDESAQKRRSRMREHLGIREDQLLLMCCGYLIERKRIDLTIDALALLPQTHRPHLLIVGTGPLTEALRHRAQSRGVVAYFTGFKEKEDLADLYRASDASVLASDDDPWGLVINEAMSFGLPLIVSDACGAGLDLLIEGENGFPFRSGDPRSLAAALDKLLASDLDAMGKRSKSIISNWTPADSARSLRELLSEVRGENHRPRGTVSERQP